MNECIVVAGECVSRGAASCVGCGFQESGTERVARRRVCLSMQMSVCGREMSSKVCTTNDCGEDGEVVKRAWWLRGHGQRNGCSMCLFARRRTNTRNSPVRALCG